MPRVVIVATGPDLDSLPAEVQDVANAFSMGGWTVRLCIGQGASRAGLSEAAAEGPAWLVWLGCHSDAGGFALDDGVLSPAELGRWLVSAGAQECVLNSCYSLEHVTRIQRAAAGVGVACSIEAAGVPDLLAWQVGVPLAEEYVESGDMAAAVRAATGEGVAQYRYIPARRRGAGGGQGMTVDRIEEQLALLNRALLGEPNVGALGLLARVNELSAQLTTLTNEQRQWRQDVERRLALMEQDRFIQVSPRLMVAGVAFGVICAILLLLLLLRLGGTI